MMKIDGPIVNDYKKSIKILAIGNSFSTDAMEHLALIFKCAGVENVSLGNLYIGGCSLDVHYKNIQTGEPHYEFRTNTGDGWNTVNEGIDFGILYDDWDIITVQQVSTLSGMPQSFSCLEPIIEHAKELLRNKNAKFLWHMTWAYQKDSTHPGFAGYDFDQGKMYDAIISAVKERVLGNPDISGVIPSGMAIQRLRESRLGDTVTRDGFHLTLGVGRYTAALTWYKRITGADISDIDVIPKDFPEVAECLDVIKEAVNYACENNPDKQ